MKFISLFFSLVLTFSFLGCSRPQKELLIDSFEGELSHNTVDYGTSEGSSLTVGPSKELKVCGEQSLKLDYNLKPSGYMWVARGFNLDVEGAARWLVPPEDIDWSAYNAFSIYMYGSNSQGIIAFDIKDAGGEMWRFLLEDDFEGWKEIVCPFNQFFVRKDWQPQDAERNEILDFPIMSFQFEPRFPPQGTYLFDCVKLVVADDK